MTSILSNGYFIHFNTTGYKELNNFIKEQLYSKIFILVDENSQNFCLPHFLPILETEVVIEVIEIEAGESHKTIQTCVEVWNVLIELGADRKSLVINLGGGVVTDMGGFIASTFKRGIHFINIPTTLLAMIDASVGGKNGVDLGTLKNQIGTITNPQMVIIDTSYLETLPQNQLKSGLAEMLKHGLIANKSHWEKLKDYKELNFEILENLIEESVQIKSNIVTQDPTENGIRKALNFGHTLGHAIETYFLENNTKATLLHGEAIAIGMILESYLSWKQNLLSYEEFEEIKNVFLAIFKKVIIQPNEVEIIMDLLIHDKKNEYGKVQFALLDGIGKTSVNQIVGNQEIIDSFKDYESL